MIPRSLQVSAVVRLFLALWLAITPSFVWAGSMTLMGVGGPAAGGAFAGLGDVKSGATYYWGLRAYNAAYATGSNASAIVCNAATFTTCSTINILANGNFDTATASGSAACSSTCVVKTLTEQRSGLSATCSAAAACPTLVFNCQGTHPCMRCAGSCNMVTGAGTSIPQTASEIVVAKRTGNFTSEQIVLTNIPSCGFGPSANTMGCYSSTNVFVSATDSNFHAGVFTLAGASSDFNIDGTPNTVNPGTDGFSPGSNTYTVGTDGFAQALVGDFMEIAVYPNSASAQASSLSSNIHSYWGF